MTIDTEGNSPDAVLSDESAMWQAEAAELRRNLRVAEGRNRALLEAVKMQSSGVVLADPEGNVLWQNGFADPTLDVPGAGNQIGEAVHQVLQDALGGMQSERVAQILGPPQRTLRITAVPVSDADEVVGAVAVAQDVVEDGQTDMGRRDFIANISHELKTPIGALGLLAETLLVEHDAAVTERLVRRMHAEAMRVGQVIDDLLNLSRIEAAGSAKADLLSARSIIDSAVSRIRYTAEHRRITIGIRGDISAQLYGNDRELVSAVHHLLENGLKYSPDGSSIEVVVRTDGDWTEIAVIDHGMGIAPQYLDRIFERFYRVDDARTRSTGGTGLGLSIVHKVVHNHGGEVRVQSEEGNGSTFTLRLAARPAHDERAKSGGFNE